MYSNTDTTLQGGPKSCQYNVFIVLKPADEKFDFFTIILYHWY